MWLCRLRLEHLLVRREPQQHRLVCTHRDAGPARGVPPSGHALGAMRPQVADCRRSGGAPAELSKLDAARRGGVGRIVQGHCHAAVREVARVYHRRRVGGQRRDQPAGGGDVLVDREHLGVEQNLLLQRREGGHARAGREAAANLVGARAVEEWRRHDQRRREDGPHREFGLVLGRRHRALPAVRVCCLRIVAALEHVHVVPRVGHAAERGGDGAALRDDLLGALPYGRVVARRPPRLRDRGPPLPRAILAPLAHVEVDMAACRIERL
mmetsp:Transcript_10112/g.23379  ORF Transcript_10112/g.23379 Transcript_10112/m.23379 type:complete len:268 (+) Transcript_10112:218-1021(+)